MKISVSGYKSIAEERSIEINGLTILSGANSSGKSSFMQPILLIKQTLESDYDAGSLLLDGANVKITDSSQIISKVPGYERHRLSISVEDSESKSLANFRFLRRRGFHIDNINLKNKDFPNGIDVHLRLRPPQASALMDFGVAKELKEAWGNNSKIGWRVARDKCFLNIGMTIDDKKSPFSFGFQPAAKLVSLATRLIHVPGLRGNPERSYKVASSDSLYPGSFEKYVASIINLWKSNRLHDSKLIKLREQLQQLGLAASIDAAHINDTRLEIRVSRYLGCKKSAADYVNIADVGFGVSQTLPVLVALLSAKKNQVVYIEQPELHLHPKAQSSLASVIAAAVSERNVRVIIETHSSILIRGIQTLVAKKQLKPEAISLYWFSQDKDTGQTNVSDAKMDSVGAFGDWPEDFDSVSLEVEQAYLDAVEEAMSE